MKIIAFLYLIIKKIYKRFLMHLLRAVFKSHGENFVFDPFGRYTYKAISVGDDVFISSGATLSASNSSIRIDNKVMFGPNVTIMGGDHNTSIIGKYMYDVKEKLPDHDQPIIIETDVWIGANVTILKGVTIGRGSIVAAGSIVIKSLPPYSISVGVPAKPIKLRWEIEDILRHELLLYPKGQRLEKVRLKELYNKFNLFD